MQVGCIISLQFAIHLRTSDLFIMLLVSKWGVCVCMAVVACNMLRWQFEGYGCSDETQGIGRIKDSFDQLTHSFVELLTHDLPHPLGPITSREFPSP